MDAENGLTIDWAPSGRNGKATLTAKLMATEAPYVHKLDVTLPKARAEFVEVLAKRWPAMSDRRGGQDLASGVG